MKNLFIFIVCIVALIKFYLDDKDMTNIHKAIGTAGSEKMVTQAEKNKKAAKINKYEVNECFKITLKNDWDAYKIVRVDHKNKDYYYVQCVKFKGCHKQIQKDLIINFEYDYPENFRTKCF